MTGGWLLERSWLPAKELRKSLSCPQFTNPIGPAPPRLYQRLIAHLFSFGPFGPFACCLGFPCALFRSPPYPHAHLEPRVPSGFGPTPTLGLRLPPVGPSLAKQFRFGFEQLPARIRPRPERGRSDACAQPPPPQPPLRLAYPGSAPAP